MPELPEVETVRRTLLPKLQGRTINEIEIITPRQIYHPDPDTFKAELEGESFTEIERRGKYLLLKLGQHTLVCHLRMSGHLYVTDPGRPRDKHLHVLFHLDDGNQLRYDDQRKFGGFHLLGPSGEGAPPGLLSLGPEPLDESWTWQHLRDRLQGKRTLIKAALLDQANLAGLGNIYVDEALHLAQIHPECLAGELTPAQIERLHGSIRQVLSHAVAKRGTTFSLYFDGDAQEGDMYDELRVFDRTGLPCPTCGTPIQKLAVAGRGTHLCTTCQVPPPHAKAQPRRARTGRRGDSVAVAAEAPKAYGTKKRTRLKEQE